jgi:nitrous oxide reductase accessory protein NosL
VRDATLPMGAFRGFTCEMCGVFYAEHPGPDNPPVFLDWLPGYRWMCHLCDRRAYGEPCVNEVGGAVQMRMEMEA